MKLPIRARLTAAFAVCMAGVLGATGAFLYVRLGSELLQAVDGGLESRADAFIAGIGSGDLAFGQGDRPLIEPDEGFAQVLDAGGAIVDASPLVERAPLLSPRDLATVTGPTFFTLQVRAIGGRARLLAVSTREDGQDLFVVVGATLDERREALHRLAALLLLGGPVALALASAAGWVVAGAALRPVERMRSEAAEISMTDVERRLPVPRTGDEMERLGTTLNAMLDRIEEAFERERRFVDDASHELRTPLGILKGEVDLALSRGRTPQELVAALQSVAEESDRLVRLAEDLLVLSRLERDRLPLHREEVRLGRVVTEAAEARRASAARAGVRVDLQVEDATVPVDPLRLRQALDNLLDNAVRHTRQGGTVRVEARTEGPVVIVVVQDDGPGFDPAVLPRAFEPFVRASDGGLSPGAGLGLAIVRAVAEAHGGQILAENRAEGGARVTLRLGG